MKVTIHLGKGNLDRGCDNIVVQLFDRDGNCRQQLNGSLPPAPELARLHQQWQSSYQAFYQERAMRIGLLQSEGLRYSEADFRQMCRQLPLEFNSWLSSACFVTVEKTLRTILSQNEPTPIIITSSEPELQKLPWHLWYLLDDYPQTEIIFSTANWQQITPQKPKHAQTRILVVLGNSAGLDLKSDLDAITSLPQTEFKILSEPRLAELNEALWQPEGWNILLFLGHSYSDLEAGYFYLNDTDKITIPQLKYSLKKAIALGLQIAIFNSCEGVGLAVELADLAIPYTVVMGQPVPDRIAQVFLKYFLNAFTAGKTFTLAIKEARQKLAGWETEFVCASWLPMIWQNPSANDLTWQDLQPVTHQPKTHFKFAKIALIGSAIASSLAILVRSLSWLEPLELAVYDRLVQQRPPETIDPRIVVVEITEEDTNSDRYPISDGVLVEAIELLNQNRPAAIGIDIHRSYERGTEHQDLVALFEHNSHIFPVCSYSSSNDSYAPPKGLSEVKLRQQMGFSDLLIDGRPTQVKNSRLDLASQNLSQIQTPKVRRQLLSYQPDLATSTSQCLTPYSLSFQLAFEYLHQAGVEPMQVNQQLQWQFGDVVFREMPDKFGGYRQLESSSQIMLNYRSGEPGKRLTLTQLRSGIDPQLIENRLVLIGYSASVARDYFNTPYGTMPGVWIHAHMTSQLISAVQDERSLIWTLPLWGDWFFIFIWSLCWGTILIVLTYLSKRRGAKLGIIRISSGQKTPIYTLLTLGIFILLIDRICLIALIRGGWLPYVPTMLSLLIMMVIVLIAPMTTHKKIK